jgi:hypothetical protein
MHLSHHVAGQLVVRIVENFCTQTDFSDIMQQPAQLDIFNGYGTEADALGQPSGINGNPPVVLPSIGIFYAQSSGDGI